MVVNFNIQYRLMIVLLSAIFYLNIIILVYNFKNMKIYIAKTNMIFIVLQLIILAGCTNMPNKIQAVKDFDVNRYHGKWYEITRLDHTFERGLSNVSATYTLRKDGGIDVLNRGFDKKKGIWKQAKGRAYFVKEKNVGRLKVTFFWPFYGGYNVIALDHENYSYALVCGPGKSYLWILAREKTLSRSLIDELVKTAQNLGFSVDKLIFVEHDLSNE
jgi:apolipoprotein D and lipocalin family protein